MFHTESTKGKHKDPKELKFRFLSVISVLILCGPLCEIKHFRRSKTLFLADQSFY
jgi:hypothetical protein